MKFVVIIYNKVRNRLSIFFGKCHSKSNVPNETKYRKRRILGKEPFRGKTVGNMGQ
jgi:hypothetical protein